MDLAFYNSDVPGKMHILVQRGMNVISLTNHFLLKYEAYSTGMNSSLEL